MALSTISVNNFSSLNIQDLIDFLGIQKVENLIFGVSQISEEQAQRAKKICQVPSEIINSWNEQELIIKHLALILDAANLEGSNFNTFAERSISAQVDKIEMCGIVDLVVAKGKYEPRNPYFFIQEYKRNKQGPNSDPLAQLLGEMLVAQVLNDNLEIYGCYIVGRFWYFVAMNNRNYTEEKPLNSTDLEDLEVIMSKLNWIKKYVEAKVK
jgi:hypothetical protein